MYSVRCYNQTKEGPNFMKVKKIVYNFLIVLFSLVGLLVLKNNNVNAAKNNHVLTVDRYIGSYVYNKNGKKLSSYHGKRAYIPANSTLRYYGTVRYINNKPFYYIGNGRYIHAERVIQLNNRGTFSLMKSSYIYNKNGQRIKPLLNGRKVTKFLSKIPINFSSSVRSTSNKLPAYYFIRNASFLEKDGIPSPRYYVPTKKINGKYYYNIARGIYIKANNVSQVNGYFINRGSISGQIGGVYNSTESVNKNGDRTVNSRRYKKGQTLKFNARILNARGLYLYRIKNSNQFISSLDLVTNKMPNPNKSLTVIDLTDYIKE